MTRNFFWKLRLFKTSLKIDLISISNTQFLRCYNIISPSVLTFWVPRDTGILNGLVGGGYPYRGVSWQNRTIINVSWQQYVPLSKNVKNNLSHFSSRDICVWNLNFLKKEISVFENSAIVKGLTDRKLLKIICFVVVIGSKINCLEAATGCVL